MRRCLVLAILLGAAVPATAAFDPPAGAVLQVQIIGSGGTAEGTCVLVGREERSPHVVLYFLTARRLFQAAQGNGGVGSLRIRVTADAVNVIETTGRTATFPAGVEQALDLAVFSVVTSETRLVSHPVFVGPLEPGDPFEIRGYRGGELQVMRERVRFRSTSLVLGDRTAADVSGFIGAPATVNAGIFGIVTECSESRVPVITALAAAQAFLTRAVPGWRASVPDEDED